SELSLLNGFDTNGETLELFTANTEEFAVVDPGSDHIYTLYKNGCIVVNEHTATTGHADTKFSFITQNCQGFDPTITPGDISYYTDDAILQFFLHLYQADSDEIIMRDTPLIY